MVSAHLGTRERGTLSELFPVLGARICSCRLRLKRLQFELHLNGRPARRARSGTQARPAGASGRFEISENWPRSLRARSVRSVHALAGGRVNGNKGCEGYSDGWSMDRASGWRIRGVCAWLAVTRCGRAGRRIGETPSCSRRSVP